MLASRFVPVSILAAAVCCVVPVASAAAAAPLSVVGATPVMPATGCSATLEERYSAADAQMSASGELPSTPAARELERYRLMELCADEQLQFVNGDTLTGPKAAGAMPAGVEVPDPGPGTVVGAEEAELAIARAGGGTTVARAGGGSGVGTLSSSLCTITAHAPTLQGAGYVASTAEIVCTQPLRLFIESCLQRDKNDGSVVSMLGCRSAGPLGSGDARYELAVRTTAQLCNASWSFRGWGHGERLYGGTWDGGYDTSSWYGGATYC